MRDRSRGDGAAAADVRLLVFLDAIPVPAAGRVGLSVCCGSVVRSLAGTPLCLSGVGLAAIGVRFGSLSAVDDAAATTLTDDRWLSGPVVCTDVLVSMCGSVVETFSRGSDVPTLCVPIKTRLKSALAAGSRAPTSQFSMSTAPAITRPRSNCASCGAEYKLGRSTAATARPSNTVIASRCDSQTTPLLIRQATRRTKSLLGGICGRFDDSSARPPVCDRVAVEGAAVSCF